MVDVVFPTGADIVQEVENLIGEVSGSGVQTFSEPMIYSALQRAFDIAFIKRPWEHYLRWDQITLDGVTGKVTEANPFGDVASPDLSDFIYIGKDGEERPLPMLNNRINPLTFSGTSLRCFTSLPVSDADFKKKRLQFWPKSATGLVNTLVRLKPVSIIDDTELFLDKLMLVAGTAWQVLEMDGTNASASDTCKQLYDMRFRDIEHALAGHPLEVSKYTGIPSDWFEHP